MHKTIRISNRSNHSGLLYLGGHGETIPSRRAGAVSRRVFEAHGTPAQEAQTVARLLVQADLMGLPSHGILRVLQYVEDICRGVIVPGAPVLVRESARESGVEVEA